MNTYSSGMRRAVALADRICLIKQNRFLDKVETVQIDEGAYFPSIRDWWRLRGLRLRADEQKTAQLLLQTSVQWLRAAQQTGIPAAFLLYKKENAMSVLYGTDMAELPAVFNAQLSQCDLHRYTEELPADFRYSGLFLGSMGMENMADILASSDLNDVYIACVAVPVSDAQAQDLLQQDRQLLEQLKPYRSFQRVYGNASRRTVEVPIPEVNEAVALLEQELGFLQQCGDGLVRTAIRFGARDQAGCRRLAELIQAGLAGQKEKPCLEPARCFFWEGGRQEKCLAVPRVRIGGNAEFETLPLSLQTLQNAAAFCVPPLHSCKGYYAESTVVEADSRDLFPVVPPIQKEGGRIGRTVNSGEPAVIPYENLLSHLAVCGSTNTGKTNLVLKLLARVWTERRIPFVVLEAAKKEYNGLFGCIPELRVYTPGADGQILQINPLQPEEGTLIENHVAAVTRAITAATGAEHPIPEAMDGLLRQTYQHFGWEYGTLAYTDPERPFPTFRDALTEVDSYIANHARYGPEVRQNLTAALTLRCERMAEGALGRMFASPLGVSAKDLLCCPTVIEMADLDEESAVFLMNILLFRFQSYLQGLTPSSQLQRLLVVEEAHNVFRKTSSEESSLARSNLAFDKLFAEVRSSGTGLILSDQRPSILPDSVMANTSVKVCFGLSSRMDRKAIGDAMGLSDAQRKEINTFQIGECLLSVRGHRGLFHIRTDKAEKFSGYSAACLFCLNRFRCRKEKVDQMLNTLDQTKIHYHLAKIRLSSYGPSLCMNIRRMLDDIGVASEPAVEFCLVGKLLAQGGFSLNESRRMLSAYIHNQ